MDVQKIIRFDNPGQLENFKFAQFDNIKAQLHPKGAVCPDRKQLQFVMNQSGVVRRWYDLGVQLLNPDDDHFLDEIQANHQKDVRACCTEMFDAWLQTKLDACWNQLCDALTEISLPVAADNIQKKFCAGHSEPGIIPQSFAYYHLILNVAERWKAEKVDLRSVSPYFSNYCSDAIAAACKENNYEGFYLAIINEKEPISLTLLEEIANKIHSGATTHLVKQYRSMIETTQYRPARTSRDRLKPEVIPWLKIASGGPSLYSSTPGVVSECEQRSSKLKNTRLCPYERSFRF